MVSLKVKVATTVALVILVSVLTLPDGASAQSNFKSFLLAHTIDPVTGAKTWDVSRWHSWLKRQNQLFKQQCRSCRSLLLRQANWFFLTNENDIASTFANKTELVQYGKENFWSEDSFPTYVFKNEEKKRRQIYDCGSQYLLVKLDANGKPYRLRGISDVKPTKGNISFNIKARCVPVPNSKTRPSVKLPVPNNRLPLARPSLPGGRQWDNVTFIADASDFEE